MGGKTNSVLTGVQEAGAATTPQPDARRIALLCFVGLLSLLMLTGCSGAGAAQRKAEAAGGVDSGFARLVITFPAEIDTQIRQSNGIVVVGFSEPLDIDVDRLPSSMSGYVSAARRDPDGAAIRLALSRRVTINTMAAGERLFIDLLPDGWTGLPPSLPKEVIEDLARRAREAERRLREQERRPPAVIADPVRVNVANLPTLTRYTFPLREAVGVTTDRDKDAFRVVFEKALKFDLADVKAALPPTVSAVEAETTETGATVRFMLQGNAEARSFSEDKGVFVVDIAKAASPVAADQGAMPDVLMPRPAPPAANAAASGAAAKHPPVQPKPAGVPLGDAARESASKPTIADANPGAPEPLPPGVTRQDIIAPERKPEIRPPAASTEVSTPVRQSDRPLMPPSHAAAPSPQKSAGTPSAAQKKLGATIAAAKREGDALRLIFPFDEATPAAIFRRADTMWFVFETQEPIDIRSMRQDAGRLVVDASSARMGDAQVVRVKFDRPRLASVSPDGAGWAVTFAESVGEPSAPLTIRRTRAATGTSAIIALEKAGRVHDLHDSELGGRLLVVTAAGPARGFLKEQDFIEFGVAQSAHGVVVEPIADDLTIERASDRVLIARPSGLTMTQTANAPSGSDAASGSHRVVLDVQSWGFDRQADFRKRRTVLMTVLSEAPEQKRNAARMDVARFYLARDMHAEAKGVLDIVVDGERNSDELARALVLRAIVSVLLDREEQALKDLRNPIVGEQHDAMLWRAVALSRLGRFAEARDGLKEVEAASAGLPIELQRFALKEAVRCAIEVGDFAEAARKLNDFDSIGAPASMKAALAVLSGRVAEGLGKINDALTAYTTAVEGAHGSGPAAALARLRQTELRHTLKQIRGEDAIAELERLTTGWRGDATEVGALQMLARLYIDASQFRDAFQVMRVALNAHPHSPLTRSIQESAAKTFEAVFLGDRGEALSPVAALGLFYDFRSLTPPGERGDQMIRRLAERLIAMDLLKQGSELLQHQIEHRLQGAARAQVAARLATVYLMDRKPAKALQALRASRMSHLSNDLRRQRLLLEARSLSETGRHDLALEIIQEMQGREVERLRADIHWAARHWRDAAEHMERLYRDRWREAAPLEASERADVLRAAIGYALAEDMIGLDRFREKYIARMAEGPDRRLFEVLTAPLSARGEEFAQAAKSVSSVDTLGAFLKDLRERFPEPADRVSDRSRASRG